MVPNSAAEVPLVLVLQKAPRMCWHVTVGANYLDYQIQCQSQSVGVKFSNVPERETMHV